MSKQTTTITRKGQVTIPIEIRRALGLNEGDRVTFIQEGEQVRLVPAGSVVARTAGMLNAYRRDPVPTAEELREAAEQAIADDVAARMADQ